MRCSSVLYLFRSCLLLCVFFVVFGEFFCCNRLRVIPLQDGVQIFQDFSKQLESGKSLDDIRYAFHDLAKTLKIKRKFLNKYEKEVLFSLVDLLNKAVDDIYDRNAEFDPNDPDNNTQITRKPKPKVRKYRKKRQELPAIILGPMEELCKTIDKLADDIDRWKAAQRLLPENLKAIAQDTTPGPLQLQILMIPIQEALDKVIKSLQDIQDIV